MPDRRSIGDGHAYVDCNWNFDPFKYSYFIYFLLIYIYLNNILGHVGFRWISDEECRGLQSGMLVSYGSAIGPRWVSDNNRISVNSNDKTADSCV